MRSVALLCVCFFVLLSTVALATPCGTTTVVLLVNSTCSIGNETFDFTGFTGDAITSSDITFTPDASNLTAPSFMLSSTDFHLATSSGNSFTQQDGYLYYHVSVLSRVGTEAIDNLGLSYANGVTTSASTGLNDGAGPEGAIEIGNVLFATNGPNGAIFETIYQETLNGSSLAVPPYSDIFPPPVTSGNGFAFYALVTNVVHPPRTEHA